MNAPSLGSSALKSRTEVDMEIERRSPTQQFRRQGAEAGFTIGQFWQWAMSDLSGNTERVVVAEYIVTNALGVADDVRNTWQAFDLRTPQGIRVEVKSAAYWQAWRRRNRPG